LARELLHPPLVQGFLLLDELVYPCDEVSLVGLLGKHPNAL
jgi:hypothetical protein